MDETVHGFSLGEKSFLSESSALSAVNLFSLGRDGATEISESSEKNQLGGLCHWDWSGLSQPASSRLS